MKKKTKKPAADVSAKYLEAIRERDILGYFVRRGSAAQAAVDALLGEAARKDGLRLRCGKCEHIWIGAYIPMLVSVFVEILRAAHCPNCGARGKDLFWMGASPAIAPKR